MQKDARANVHSIKFSGDTARTIVRVLYSNAPTYLDRKMEAAQEIIHPEYEWYD